MHPGEDVEPIVTRERVFLTDVDAKVLCKDPRVLPLLTWEHFNLTLGPGRFVITRRLFSGHAAMMFVVMDHSDPLPVDGNWNIPGDVEELRALFSGFNEPIRAYLEHVHKVDMWQMAYGKTLDRWHSLSGRVVLIGDAAHAMLPHKGQGLSQGIEDGVALARALRWVPQLGVRGAVEGWEQVRRPRVERIIEATFDNAGSNALEDGPRQEARDRFIRAMTNGAAEKGARWELVEANRDAPFTSKEYRKWEYDYDAQAEVRDYPAKLNL